MELLSSLTSIVLLFAALTCPASADADGTYLWDPPVPNEANVYARVIELKHAGDLNGNLLATWEHWYERLFTTTRPC
jgi:hypothetical protein